jgi:hypothetical protein
MSAVASTIFKIRAHSDYISQKPDVLSFRQGQPFYALCTDLEKGFYFVSTQFAVPFSRNAVNGLVPISYFEKVDLLSKEKDTRKVPKPTHQPAMQPNGPTVYVDGNAMPVPVRKQSLTHNPDWSILQQPVSSLKVLSQTNGMFAIKVVRGNQMHIVNRTTHEFHQYATQIQSLVDLSSIPASDNVLLNVERILVESIQVQSRLVTEFFQPKDANELLAGPSIVRRDSGTSEFPEEPRKRKNSAFSKLLNLFV